jgi:protein TonB
LGSPKVSQGVTGGRQVLRVQPLYPQAARTMRVTGIVVVRARVSKKGTVSEVEVVSGPAMLRSAAADAVKRWKYEPFLLNGQPIENDISVQVRFDLPQT